MANHILKNENSVLQGLFQKLAEIKQFQTLFSEQVGPDLASHCQVVKFEKNCLFVLTENGSWATQLRFQIPQLMVKLKNYSLLKNLNGIICKTRPTIYSKSPKKPRAAVPLLSSQTAEALLFAAKTIKDAKLRAILEKIATHTKSL